MPQQVRFVNAMKLYNTPLSVAIAELFSKIREKIDEEYPSLPAGQVKAYIFGGAAIHIYTNARYSKDVDAQLDARIPLETSDFVVSYTHDDGRNFFLTLDGNFNDALTMVHPDYQDDAIPLLTEPDSPIWVYLPLPVDLAISKVVRFQEVDREDIRILAERGLITESEFTERVEEAKLSWPLTLRFTQYNILDAKKIIRNAQK
jgi:hypothetical protein